MFDAHGQRGLLDLTQAGLREELAQVSFAAPGQARLALHVGKELAYRAPEERERRLLAGVIPDARGDDAAGARYTSHLAETADRIRHEVNDQLGEGGIEGRVRKRQLLGGRPSDID